MNNQQINGLSKVNKDLKLPPVDAIIALWALSESALGGVLHAFRIPLTGLIIGSSAIIFITLLAYYGKKRGTILKATIIVLLVKGLISPHTPLAAYAAVFLQGLLGELFFYKKRFFLLSAIILGICVGFLSAFQKVFILTIVFGHDLWKAIDQFLSFIIQQLFFLQDAVVFQYSFLFIGIYAFLHLITGIVAGIIGAKLPASVKAKAKEESFRFSIIENNLQLNQTIKRKRKNWWQRPTGILLFIVLIGAMLASYLQPESNAITVSNLLVMLMRSLLILLLWFIFIGPLLLKGLRFIMEKQKNRYTDEVDKVINALPILKIVVRSAWKSSTRKKGLKRISFFVTTLFLFLLTSGEESSQ